MPSCRAASILAWPAIRPPSSPTSAGVVHRGDLGIRVGPGIFRVRDQPIDRPPLDPVRRPRSLISVADSRAGARAERGEVLALVDDCAGALGHPAKGVIVVQPGGPVVVDHARHQPTAPRAPDAQDGQRRAPLLRYRRSNPRNRPLLTMSATIPSHNAGRPASAPSVCPALAQKGSGPRRDR
jgi:hypothetical protein